VKTGIPWGRGRRDEREREGKIGEKTKRDFQGIRERRK